MPRDATKVMVEQTIGTNKVQRYNLATVLQILCGPEDEKVQVVSLEERLRRGERVQSIPGVSYQVIPEHREDPSTG